MPFSNDGSYAPPSGATTALPGNIIRSATWNSVFADIAVALTATRTSYLQTGSVATKTADYTVGGTDGALIFNATITSTLTMPSASSYPGRWLYVKQVSSGAVVASATIVQPLVGPAGTLGTTIVGTTAGKYAALVSDGTNWVIMQGN